MQRSTEMGVWERGHSGGGQVFEIVDVLRVILLWSAAWSGFVISVWFFSSGLNKT
jgi:hypothetical protein